MFFGALFSSEQMDIGLLTNIRLLMCPIVPDNLPQPAAIDLCNLILTQQASLSTKRPKIEKCSPNGLNGKNIYMMTCIYHKSRICVFFFVNTANIANAGL